MRGRIFTLAAALLIFLLLPSVSRAADDARTGKPVRSCESLASETLLNTTIESAAIQPAAKGQAEYCLVVAIVTHPPANDHVKIWAGWNGRFEGTGGGGFTGGGARGVIAPVSEGYAAGATDTGHASPEMPMLPLSSGSAIPGGSSRPAAPSGPSASGGGEFALDQSGHLNWMLIRDNAYLGIHEMTRVGKAMAAAYYGKSPHHSYFAGCSSGGRQALSEAQRYPDDYDGIISGSPAINWAKFIPAEMWGQAVMNDLRDFVPQCKLAAASAEAVEACDAQDGVKDGVVRDPRTCKYDPSPLVGTKLTDCGEFTAADAEVLRKIWQGPRRSDGSFLWYGLERGADASQQASISSDGKSGSPFPIPSNWFQLFLNQNSKWDLNQITQANFDQYFTQSVEEFGSVYGTDNPDLSAFRDHGGKLIVWHGWLDAAIFPEGTVDYYQRVQKQLGKESADTFSRLFMLPGVEHCGDGPGPQMEGGFDALISWVEQGHAPDALTAVKRDSAGKITLSRPLCAFPKVATYKGTDSTDDASNFLCAAP